MTRHGEVLVPAPGQPTLPIPSLLGRDVISRFALIIDYRTGRVLFLTAAEASQLRFDHLGQHQVVKPKRHAESGRSVHNGDSGEVDSHTDKVHSFLIASRFFRQTAIAIARLPGVTAAAP